MKFGAGVVAARAQGADEIVDPRPWAIGTIDETFRKYDVGPVLPAMGYSNGQLAEMEKIIDTAEADVVVIGTPIDLRRVIEIRKPAVRVRYDLDVLPDSPSLLDVLGPVLGSSQIPPTRVAFVRVRVVVYNVRGFRDGFERLVRLVGHFEPDVVLLNESGSRWRLGRFAKALGMGVARDPWSPFRRRVKDAVLVRPTWWIAETGSNASRAPRSCTRAAPWLPGSRTATRASARSRPTWASIRASGSPTPASSGASSPTWRHRS